MALDRYQGNTSRHRRDITPTEPQQRRVALSTAIQGGAIHIKRLLSRVKMCAGRKAKVDSDGRVRSCDVGVLPRDKRRNPLPYVNKGLLTMTVPIQRLCMVTPVEQLEERPTVTGEAINHVYTQWSTSD